MSNFIIPQLPDSNGTTGSNSQGASAIGPSILLAPWLRGSENGQENGGDSIILPQRQQRQQASSEGRQNPLDVTFATSIFTQTPRPPSSDSNNGVNHNTNARGEGINASINVNANITPNINIRIELPEATRNRTRPESSGRQSTQQQFNGTTGLPREIMTQITNSVNRLNDTGEALVIEGDGPTHNDLGRVVGEAVAQTLQHLTHETPDVTTRTNGTSNSQSSRPSTRPGPSSQTTQSSSSTNSRKRKRPTETEDLFKESELKLPIVEYLVGSRWEERFSGGDCGVFMREFVTELNAITVQEFINVFNGKCASDKICSFLETTLKLDYLPRALATYLGRLFAGIQPKPDCDIVESNLSLLRHFLRDLAKNLKDRTSVAPFLVQFINLWVGLNCDILRGGQETFERCLGDIMVTHPVRHLSQFVTWSREQAFSIDGYVMSEKISTIDDEEPSSASV